MVKRTPRRIGVMAALVGALAAVIALTIGSGVGQGAGLSASTARATAAPTVILGTKDFTEEFVLGQLYKQALEAKGIKVTYKENIGSTEVIQTALRSGKINAYPEYVGEIVQTAYHKTTGLPKTAHGWWALAKSFLAKDGYTLSNATPFFDVDAIAVRKADAQKYNLKTLYDLKKLQDSGKAGKLSIGARPEFKNREEGFKGMQDVYGLTKLKYVSIATGLTYQALDQKKVFCINVFSTDAAISSGKYTVLTDPKLIFGVQNVAVIVKKDIATSAVLSVLNAVSAKLTTPAILAMNKATQINKQSPAKVAGAFLKANGLK